MNELSTSLSPFSSGRWVSLATGLLKMFRSNRKYGKGNGDMLEQHTSHRAYFLRAALLEAMKWCEPPDQLVAGTFSDQYWLRAFSSSSSPVTEQHVRRFLAAYSLARQGQWNHKAVAARITVARNSFGSTTNPNVREFAQFLSRSVSRGEGKKRQQTSAASKFLFFMNPLSEVFVWDKLATVSIRFREWHRSGAVARPRTFGRPFASAKGQHDYLLYRDACGRALADERNCPDFVASVEKFRVFLRDVGGPMGSAPVVSSSFVERRYFDKLLWCEGMWIEASRTNVAEEAHRKSRHAEPGVGADSR